MRPVILTLLFAAIILSCKGNQENNEASEIIPPEIDTLLAEKLGADDYGMKQYVIAFLKRGPNRSTDKEEAANLQRAHLENITKLANEGKLVLAGPFLGKGDLRGIYIFNVKTVEEAEALTNTDPAIQSGSLEMELHPWYGSAALMKVSELHKRIAKKQP